MLRLDPKWAQQVLDCQITSSLSHCRVTLQGTEVWQREFNISAAQAAKVTRILVQWKTLDRHAEEFKDYDNGFCTLGTT